MVNVESIWGWTKVLLIGIGVFIIVLGVKWVKNFLDNKGLLKYF